ncbi:1-phosphofructokinase [Fusobacterium nucleatum]|uniref:1-phosphofructokinase n=1 Tax=Fusobacterium nucleatum TaxID=851 RepID=UPI001EEF8058|nr:1-phosphofructokinase [Fusobacterium nucleatum]MCG6845576.1 1-phosphofructokinase [Fusobacterium nucleatum]MCL4584653.1 1-phosphofructokinase [Fusobacterium nucleatum YWH7055]
MIYSVTLNPSIDFIIRVKDFQLGETNRAYEDNFFAGGKGIMVSKLLKNVKTDCVNLGFLGGFTGTFIEQNLKKLNILSDFVTVNENTRVNVKLKTETETEINCQGPKISDSEKEEFLDKIRKIKSDDFVILSGSVPSNLGNDFYITIIEILNKNGVKFTLDSSGETFSKSLKYKPFLIKPNKDELKEYARIEFKNNQEIVNYVRENLVDKAEHVIISLGGEGALYIDKNFSLFAYPLRVKENVVNTVGAGDSVVAGFVNYMLKHNDVERAFRFAVACGTATSFSEDIGKLNFIEEIYNKLVIERKCYGN